MSPRLPFSQKVGSDIFPGPFQPGLFNDSTILPWRCPHLQTAQRKTFYPWALMTRNHLSRFGLDSSLNCLGWAYACRQKPTIPILVLKSVSWYQRYSYWNDSSPRNSNMWKDSSFVHYSQNRQLGFSLKKKKKRLRIFFLLFTEDTCLLSCPHSHSSMKTPPKRTGVSTPGEKQV